MRHGPAVILLALLAGSLGSGAPKNYANVRLIVTDLLGDPIPVKSLQFRSTEGDFAGRFHPGYASSIPWGRYMIRVVSPGFDPWRREIEIARPSVLIPVGLEAGEIESPPKYCHLEAHVSGLQRRMSNDGPLWARAFAVFGDQSFSTEISAGRFTFDDVPCGKYLITVISGSEVLSVTPTLVSADHASIGIAVGQSRDIKREQ